MGGIIPHKNMIDDFTNDHPVYIQRTDGHQALANSLALKLTNITNQTPDPPGGTIEKDENNQLTGILKGNAMFLVGQHVPNNEDFDQVAIEKAQEYLIKNGITSVHDVSNLYYLKQYQRTHIENNLKLRMKVGIQLKDWSIMKDLVQTTETSDFFEIGLVSII